MLVTMQEKCTAPTIVFFHPTRASIRYLKSFYSKYDILKICPNSYANNNSHFYDIAFLSLKRSTITGLRIFIRSRIFTDVAKKVESS